MKAKLLDTEALRSVSPAALAAFARAEGWAKTDEFGAHSNVYSSSTGAQEIILPRTELLGDYPSVVSKLVSIFAEELKQDEISIYRDLSCADRDVIRVRCFGGIDDGSLELDAGVEVVQQSRNMLLAAACAARQPQPLFRAGANKDATDYMRRVRLGQTEIGSFVVTLLAPVPPSLEQTSLFPDSWSNLDNEPYDRLVTRRLVQALEASRSATERAASGEGMAAFEKAVSQGVSANLCEALSQMIEQSSGLDISLTWAKTRPTPEPKRKISFTSSDAEILREAARTFRSRHPIPNVHLVATVHKLKRDQDEIDGLVTLKALVEDKWQSVNVVLDQANYSEAVKAHDNKHQVLVAGDLQRVKQRWQLVNAELTALVPEDDDD